METKMLCINLDSNEVEWIKNSILDRLETLYCGIQPPREEIIDAPLERFADLSLEDWETMCTLYQKLM